MNKTLKYIICGVVIVLFIAGSVFAFIKLTEKKPVPPPPPSVADKIIAEKLEKTSKNTPEYALLTSIGKDYPMAYKYLPDEQKAIISEADYINMRKLEENYKSLKSETHKFKSKDKDFPGSKTTYPEVQIFEIHYVWIDSANNNIESAENGDVYIVKEKNEWKFFNTDLTNERLRDKRIALDYFKNANLNALKNNHEVAVDFYDKAIKKNPGFTLSYYGIASSLMYLKNYDDALANLKLFAETPWQGTVNEINTTDEYRPVAYYNMAICYNYKNDKANAKLAIDKAIDKAIELKKDYSEYISREKFITCLTINSNH